MTERPPRRLLDRLRTAWAAVSPRWRAVAALAALGAGAALLVEPAYHASFSTTRPYDDEGYVLISLRAFVDGGALYDEVYSQYGPGFFVLVGGALKLLGVPLTTDGARFATLAFWLGASLMTGVALLRLTRSLVIAAAGLLLAFFLLTTSTFEPLHPTSAISFLLVALACAAALLLPARPRAAMAAIGALTVALLTIKINVGLLAAAAIGFAILTTAPRLHRRSAPRVAGCVLLVAVPFALLAGNLDQGWVRSYAAVVSLGLAAYAIVALRLPAAVVPVERHLRSLLAGAGALLVLVLTVPLIGGMSVSGLAHGVVLDPLELDSLFTIPLILPGYAPFAGVAGIGGALLLRWRLEQGAGERERFLGGALALAAGLAIWTSIAGPGVVGPDYAAPVAVGAALSWVATIPARRDGPEVTFLRALLPGLALLQLLHGYPVAGSQLGASELLLVIVGGICICDGVERLSGAGASIRPAPIAWRGASLLAVVAFAGWLYLSPIRDYSRSAERQYEASVPLELPGAQRLRQPPEQVEQLQALVADIRSRCEAFLTMPGMNSLYLYTEQDPPTAMNGTAWMWLFDPEKQAEIVERVRGAEGLCAVKNEFLIHFWTQLMADPLPDDRPLVRLIERDFETASELGQAFNVTEVMVRPDSRP